MMEHMTEVPCNGCTLCCRNDMLIIHPECGDDPAQYDTIPCTHPLTGEPAVMLRHSENGDCVYLDRVTGCTIHGRAPAICREFDCRKSYLQLLQFSRKERLSLIARGIIGKDVLAAGRKRLPTLKD